MGQIIKAVGVNTGVGGRACSPVDVVIRSSWQWAEQLQQQQ